MTQTDKTGEIISISLFGIYSGNFQALTVQNVKDLSKEGPLQLVFILTFSIFIGSLSFFFF